MVRAADHEQVFVFHWLTQHHAALLGPTLDHAYPVDYYPCFDVALEAIDEAERQVWGDRDPAAEPRG